MANLSDQPAPPSRKVSAAQAKNQFGQVLERVIAGETVAITKYGEVRAMLVSAERYEALSEPRARRLNLLTDHFDRMLAEMQRDKAKRAMELGFNASPIEMGRAALRQARASRATRELG